MKTENDHARSVLLKLIKSAFLLKTVPKIANNVAAISRSLNTVTFPKRREISVE